MRKLSLSLIMLLLCLGAWAQIQSPVSFTVSKRALGENELEVVFSARIARGWHVYGPDIAEGGPTKAEVTLEKQEGVKPVGGLKVVGKLHRGMDPLFGMEVSYLENQATLVQRYRITAAKYNVQGYLTYGACDDRNCLPPTDVEFSFAGDGPKQEANAAEPAVEPSDKPQPADSVAAEPAIQAPADSALAAPSVAQSDWWKPMIGELQALNSAAGTGHGAEYGLLTIFLLGLLGGLAALVTPCVWPIIPMTVSFFLKRSKDNRAKAVRDALTYGLSIVVIYVGLGLLVSATLGASALNDLATNAVFNIFFFLMLVVFGASFLGGFEITLPSSWSNAVDSKAGKTTGLLSIFLMAFTLTLVSFSCTGPIIGFLLVEVSANASYVAPAMGMLGFAVALALPFTLFALFPQVMKKAPKSGNWMNCVKVCLGFLELAFALKFLSVADLAYGWHILDREVFLALWIVLFALLGAYLVGWIRFPHDEDEYDDMGQVVVNPRTGVIRFFMALLSFAFAMYMVPGLWGAPVKAVSAFAPPMSTQDFKLGETESGKHFYDYEEGMAYAREHKMPVLLDFTGYGCVNCRKMEAAVWTDSKVQELITGKYVLISLYIDEKKSLPETLVVEENGQQRKLRTVGDKWSYLQRVKFGANAQPFYVLLDNEGRPLTRSYSFDENVDAYVRWLQEGLKKYEE
ncbi:MAG: cytochrome c biogenesis protein CcdA [Bacteroidaceae bacterium]|nr:cytochrome c biogenesis protein CcdA [Prevotellaceae bacterium]MDY5631279.1 cytochrome c biogenesis protein CcdA [Bacteroidaceae bacterium]